MSDVTPQVKIRFEGVSLAEAGKMAEELRQEVLDSTPDVKAEVVKDDPTTMDFGATLVLVLGAPAVVVIAKGIQNYLIRRGAVIRIEANGAVVAENVAGSDLVQIVEAIKGKPEKKD